MSAGLWDTPVLLEEGSIACRARGCAKQAFLYLTFDRGRRVLYLLVGVWILNAFDLSLTLRAQADGMLHERNPLARAILSFGAPAIFAFNAAAVAGATCVLYRLRSHRCAEVASVLVLFAYVGVACQWMLCYEMYELSHVGGAGVGDFARVDALAQYLPVF